MLCRLLQPCNFFGEGPCIFEHRLKDAVYWGCCHGTSPCCLPETPSIAGVRCARPGALFHACLKRLGEPNASGNRGWQPFGSNPSGGRGPTPEPRSTTPPATNRGQAGNGYGYGRAYGGNPYGGSAYGRAYGGYGNYSRPTLNMSKPIVTPRSYGGSRPSGGGYRGAPSGGSHSAPSGGGHPSSNGHSSGGGHSR